MAGAGRRCPGAPSTPIGRRVAWRACCCRPERPWCTHPPAPAHTCGSSMQSWAPPFRPPGPSAGRYAQDGQGQGGSGGRAVAAGRGSSRPPGQAAALPTCTKGISIFFCSSSVAILLRSFATSDRGPPAAAVVSWDLDLAVMKQAGVVWAHGAKSSGRKSARGIPKQGGLLTGFGGRHHQPADRQNHETLRQLLLTTPVSRAHRHGPVWSV